MKAVFDTNVLISAFLYAGVPAWAIRLATGSSSQLLISATIFAELRTKLRLKFKREDSQIDRITDVLNSLALVVGLSEIVAACRDPKDDHVLACAVAGEADYIVTGDKDLLAMKVYQGDKIVTARQFVDAAIAQ